LEGGKWGLPGGFVDRDETLKEAAAREVLEETGWQVKDLQLLTIRDRPDRPKEDRQNISCVFIAQAVEEVGEADWESDDVQWFELDKVPAKELIAFDHVSNISLYQRYLKEGLDLPIFT
jgi:8-oxo-dGTP diphosphatase